MKNIQKNFHKICIQFEKNTNKTLKVLKKTIKRELKKRG